MGLDIDVLSGEDEARLIYRGVLQFLPLYEKSVLTIDIGGGSTEFVIGHKGEVLFAASLTLGHVCLTELFVEKSKLDDLRRHIRTVLYESSVVSKVRDLGFEVAVGSSGTIRSIERAIFLGCAGGLLGGELSREWRFTREELGLLVNKLCDVGLTEVNGVRRLGFSKKRAEYIVAGAILLSEIFDALSITEMEVSGYALGEGVVSEMLERDSVGYDMNVNARWRSVVGLAVRCDGENRMKSAVRCLSIAKEIFDGIRRSHKLGECRGRAAACLDEKDSEYLEAGVLLHNIGLMFGQKGYHKLSYKIIKNGAHLHGYSPEELELVALLARFHRKKYPRYKHTSLLNSQMELKFRGLCVIIRVSHALQQSQCPAFQGLEVSFGHEGFRLVLTGLKDHQLISHDAKQASAIVDTDLQSELEHFEEVFEHKLIISLAKSC